MVSAMIRLHELLSEELVNLDLKEGNKFQVIEDLLELTVQAGRISDRQTALDDLLERERYLSTGFENGLAVPHAKTKAVSEIVLAFGLSKDGVEFDSLDGKPTHFIFLLLSPMDTGGPHIQTLALIARNFQKPETIERLHQVDTHEDLLEVFKEFA